MQRPRRAAAALVVVALAHLSWGILFLGFGALLYAAMWTLAAAGLAVGAAGLAWLEARPGLAARAVAAGFGVAAVAYLVMAVPALSGSGLYNVGFVLGTLGLAQAAWFGSLWTIEGGAGAARRAAGVRLSLGVLGAGIAWFLLLNLAQGDLAFVPGTATAAPAMALAVRDLRP